MMDATIPISVERSDPQSGRAPALESYEVPAEAGATVLGALLHIHETSESGLAFRCGCRNQDCGLCAVDVNGRPRLACITPLRKGMVIRPLRRLPVARDLIIDRRWILTFLERFGLFVSDAGVEEKPPRLSAPPEHARLAACTECLSCLAACPSFEHGRGEIGGPYHFVKLAQLHWDPRDSTDRRAQARELGIARCAACRKCACPLGIPVYRAAVAPLAAV
jgi:succinate dehydrogenase/fumarate reductase iron-sulfur protein